MIGEFTRKYFKNGVKIVCLDFDGVLHSYKTGWGGPWSILDEPVEGMVDFIDGLLTTQRTGRDARGIESIFYNFYRIAIYSSRSKFPFARTAMKNWMLKKGTDPRYFREGLIYFPLFKPPAHITIDDRAVSFTGEWPDRKFIDEFRPWNKKEI